MTSIGLELPPLQKAFQMLSTWDLRVPVITVCCLREYVGVALVIVADAAAPGVLLNSDSATVQPATHPRKACTPSGFSHGCGATRSRQGRIAKVRVCRCLQKDGKRRHLCACSHASPAADRRLARRGKPARLLGCLWIPRVGLRALPALTHEVIKIVSHGERHPATGHRDVLTTPNHLVLCA